MTMRTLLSRVCGVGFLMLVMTAPIVANAKSNGGSGASVDTFKNIVVVDSSTIPITIGEVVGVRTDDYQSGLLRITNVLLNPALANQDGSLLVNLTASQIFGTDGNLWFQTNNCTGTGYFETAGLYPVYKLTFVEGLPDNAFRVHYANLNINGTLMTFASHLLNTPGQPQSCVPVGVSSYAIPAAGTFEMSLNPPFKIVNP